MIRQRTRHLILPRLRYFILLGCGVACGFLPAQAADLGGTVIAVTGRARVQHLGGANWSTLYKGAAVSDGDRVSTDSDSTMQIRLNTGSVLRLGENAQVDLVSAGAITTIKVWFGKLWASVKKILSPESKFEVETPTAVAAARGTEYQVDVTDGDDQEPAGTRVTVFDGEVDVTDLVAKADEIEDRPTTWRQQRDQFVHRVGPNESLRIDRARMLRRQLRGGIGRVGVLPFEQRGDPVGQELGPRVATLFAVALQRAAAERFKVVPPAEMQQALNRLAASWRDVRHPAALAEAGRQGKVDVVVAGVVTTRLTDGGRLPQPRAYGRDGRRARPMQVQLSLSIWLFHVGTQQPIFARTVQLGGGESRTRLAEMIGHIADQISAAVPRVAKVAKVQENVVTLGSGTRQGLRQGGHLVIVKANDWVKDPDTGRPIAPRTAGVIQITQVGDHSAIARIVSRRGDATVAAGDAAVPLPAKAEAAVRLRQLDAATVRERQWQPQTTP